MEDSKVKTRVICNPASSGGGYEPTELHGELEGYDLAATLAIPEDPAEAAAVLRQSRVRTLDVVRVRSEGIGEQFFINVATGGMGAEVSGAADAEMKGRWGKLSYLRASL